MAPSMDGDASTISHTHMANLSMTVSKNIMGHWYTRRLMTPFASFKSMAIDVSCGSAILKTPFARSQSVLSITGYFFLNGMERFTSISFSHSDCAQRHFSSIFSAKLCIGSSNGYIVSISYTTWTITSSSMTLTRSSLAPLRPISAWQRIPKKEWMDGSSTSQELNSIPIRWSHVYLKTNTTEQQAEYSDYSPLAQSLIVPSRNFSAFFRSVLELFPWDDPSSAISSTYSNGCHISTPVQCGIYLPLHAETCSGG